MVVSITTRTTHFCVQHALPESRFLGVGRESGWVTPFTAQQMFETDSQQVPWRRVFACPSVCRCLSVSVGVSVCYVCRCLLPPSVRREEGEDREKEKDILCDPSPNTHRPRSTLKVNDYHLHHCDLGDFVLDKIWKLRLCHIWCGPYLVLDNPRKGSKCCNTTLCKFTNFDVQHLAVRVQSTIPNILWYFFGKGAREEVVQTTLMVCLTSSRAHGPFFFSKIRRPILLMCTTRKRNNISRNLLLPRRASNFKFHTFGRTSFTIKLCVVLTADYHRGMENTRRAQENHNPGIGKRVRSLSKARSLYGNCWCLRSTN